MVCGVESWIAAVMALSALPRGFHLPFANAEKMLPGVVGFERDAKGFQLPGFDERFKSGHCSLTMRLTAPTM